MIQRYYSTKSVEEKEGDEPSDSNDKSKDENSINQEDFPPQITHPTCDIPLVSFGVFKSLQPPDSSDDELRKEYESYRETHAKRLAQWFYDNYNEDEWFKEQFNPDVYYELYEEKKKLIERGHKAFLDEINIYSSVISFEYDKESFNEAFTVIETPFIKAPDENEGTNIDKHKAKETNGVEEKKVDCSDIFKKYHVLDTTTNSVFIPRIPSFLPSKFLLEEIGKTKGVRSISISQPIKSKGLIRYCWVTYDSEANYSQGLENLNQISFNSFYLYPVKSESDSFKRIIRTTPPLFPARMVEDIVYVKKIIELYAKFNGLNPSELFDLFNAFSFSEIIQLDLLLLYLRKVFGFCYYCLKDYKDERSAMQQCGLVHLRSAAVIDTKEKANKESEIYLNDKAFTKAIEKVLSKGLEHPFTPNDYASNKEIQSELEKYFEGQIKERTDGRMSCLACDKIFIEKEFILKHFHQKHADLIKENVYRKHSSKREKEEFMKSDCKEQWYLKEQKRIIITEQEYHKVLSLQKEKGTYFRAPKTSKMHGYIDYDSLALKSNPQLKLRPSITYDDL